MALPRRRLMSELKLRPPKVQDPAGISREAAVEAQCEFVVGGTSDAPGFTAE
jgi:hypothetical protein